MLHRTLVVLLLTIVCAAPATAQTVRKVYNSGTSAGGDATYTNAQLQSALDDAVPGDFVLLEENITYEGQFVLPSKSCPANDATCYITLRTGVDASGFLLDDSEFPAANVRITPAYLPTLAKLKVVVNNTPALRTELPGECGSPPCVAKWWKVQHIGVTSNLYGGGTLILFGYWDISFAGSAIHQDTKAKVPSNIIFDQNVVYGDPVSGQLRCMNIAAKDILVTNNYFKDCKTHQNDGQAITVSNTPGPVTIINNYLEGSSENVLIGGFDVIARESTTVSSAASASEFTVGHVDELEVGQWIGVGGPTLGVEQSAKVTSIVGTTITVTPALTGTPSVGAMVRWSLHVGSLTFQKNHLLKPLAWRGPVVPTPGTPSGAGTTGGSLADATYHYKIVARHNVDQAQVFRSTASAEGSCVVSGVNNACELTWNASANVTPTYDGEYYIYGRTSGGQNIRFSISAADAGCSAGTGTCTFTDVGDAGTSEDVPTTDGNEWSIKNLFETKECGATLGSSCLIEGNLFEQTWWNVVGQQSAAITLHLKNDDQMVSAVTRNLTFRNNMIRMGPGAISVAQSETGTRPAGVAENITVQNNLFYQLGSDQGHYIWTVYMPGGNMKPSECGRNIFAGTNITFDHNTFISSSSNRGYFVVTSSANISCDEMWTHENLKIKNNIFMHGVDGDPPGTGFGFNYEGLSGFSSPNGNDTWAVISSGASKEWAHNVIQGANSSFYTDCTNCLTPDQTTFEAYFVDYASENFRVTSGSPLFQAGTDGADIGADIDAIEEWTDIALSGDNSGTSPFGGTPEDIPGTVQCEDFDEGGSGSAYADNSAENEGGEYRDTEVDISVSEGPGGGYTLSFVGAGEWLQYTVDVGSGGRYNFSFMIASDGAGGTFHLEVDGEDVTGPMTVPNTGGWQSWQLLVKSGVVLQPGEQTWRLVMDTNGGVTGAVGNFDFFQVALANGPFRMRIIR
jgi:hypothetical protein